jgi:hypothetical protein
MTNNDVPQSFSHRGEQRHRGDNRRKRGHAQRRENRERPSDDSTDAERDHGERWHAAETLVDVERLARNLSTKGPAHHRECVLRPDD